MYTGWIGVRLIMYEYTRVMNLYFLVDGRTKYSGFLIIQIFKVGFSNYLHTCVGKNVILS